MALCSALSCRTKLPLEPKDTIEMNGWCFQSNIGDAMSSSKLSLSLSLRSLIEEVRQCIVTHQPVGETPMEEPRLPSLNQEHVNKPLWKDMAKSSEPTALAAS